MFNGKSCSKRKKGGGDTLHPDKVKVDILTKACEKKREKRAKS
jgi:hypothetical protein